MPTIRLTPSTYAVSSTSYLSVTDAENMYTNTDSTTHATITNIYNSTSSRYLYLRGFNFSDIPSAAVINSFSVKIKGNETSLSTSTSYAPRLANGTSTLSGTTASSNFGTSVSTITIPTGALTWEQISETYGSNFTIVVYVRRSSRNTTGYFYCYGAEIEVDYTVPNPRTITTTLTGDGTIDPSGSTISYDDEEFELTITPTDKTATVTVTQDGVDVTSQLVPHGEQTTGTCAYDADTSGGTATAAEILNTKIAYVNGVELTGNMPNRGAVTGTITTKAQQYTIQNGYHDGSGKVGISSTEQAKIIAGNIKSGVSILGVTGNYSGEAVNVQAKTATPTTSQQTILPDTGYDYLSQVTVEAIPVTRTDNAYGGVTVTIG